MLSDARGGERVSVERRADRSWIRRGAVAGFGSENVLGVLDSALAWGGGDVAPWLLTYAQDGTPLGQVRLRREAGGASELSWSGSRVLLSASGPTVVLHDLATGESEVLELPGEVLQQGWRHRLSEDGAGMLSLDSIALQLYVTSLP